MKNSFSENSSESGGSVTEAASKQAGRKEVVVSHSPAVRLIAAMVPMPYDSKKDNADN